MIIDGVGKSKIEYKDHNTVEFSPLAEYITLAQKTITKFANKFSNGLTKRMLADEDAISSVAYALMMGDWRYDSSHENEKGEQKTKYSYRNQCAIWAIRTYVAKEYKIHKHKNISLDFVMDDDNDIYSIIENEKDQTPDDKAIDKEEKEQQMELINMLLSADKLSQKQKKYIRMYYLEGLTYAEIGKRHSLTREAVRQSILKGISHIKEQFA